MPCDVIVFGLVPTVNSTRFTKPSPSGSASGCEDVPPLGKLAALQLASCSRSSTAGAPLLVVLWRQLLARVGSLCPGLIKTRDVPDPFGELGQPASSR